MTAAPNTSNRYEASILLFLAYCLFRGIPEMSKRISHPIKNFVFLFRSLISSAWAWSVIISTELLPLINLRFLSLQRNMYRTCITTSDSSPFLFWGRVDGTHVRDIYFFCGCDWSKFKWIELNLIDLEALLEYQVSTLPSISASIFGSLIFSERIRWQANVVMN